MFGLNSIGPFQIILIAALFASIFSVDENLEELNVMGNLIVAIGSLVLTVAAQKVLLQKNQEALAVR